MWINKYVKLMYPKRLEDVQMEEAIQLKYDYIPKSLFKYRAIDEYSIKNFENDVAWFNIAAEFNDPYDCVLTTGDFVGNNATALLKDTILDMKRDLNIEVTKEELARLENMGFKEMSKLFVDFCRKNLGKEVEDLAKETILRIQEEGKRNTQVMNETMQISAKICCFSEIKDSILMWSHYANNHKGFCIEYDFKKEGINPALTDRLQPVLYEENLFNIGQYFHEVKGGPNSINPLILKYGSIIKSTEWSYEKEWRITYITPSEQGFSKELFSPQAIYLGAKMCEEDKKRLIEIAKQKRILVYQMKREHNEFKLVPEKVL